MRDVQSKRLYGEAKDVPIDGLRDLWLALNGCHP